MSICRLGKKQVSVIRINGVRIKGYKWVEFRENVMCPATVRKARLKCIQLALLDELLL